MPLTLTRNLFQNQPSLHLPTPTICFKANSNATHPHPQFISRPAFIQPFHTHNLSRKQPICLLKQPTFRPICLFFSCIGRNINPLLIGLSSSEGNINPLLIGLLLSKSNVNPLLIGLFLRKSNVNLLLIGLIFR